MVYIEAAFANLYLRKFLAPLKAEKKQNGNMNGISTHLWATAQIFMGWNWLRGETILYPSSKFH